MYLYQVFMVWEDFDNGDCKTFFNVYLTKSKQKAISMAKSELLSKVTGNGKITDITAFLF